MGDEGRGNIHFPAQHFGRLEDVRFATFVAAGEETPVDCGAIRNGVGLCEWNAMHIEDIPLAMEAAVFANNDPAVATVHPQTFFRLIEPMLHRSFGYFRLPDGRGSDNIGEISVQFFPRGFGLEMPVKPAKEKGPAYAECTGYEKPHGIPFAVGLHCLYPPRPYSPSGLRQPLPVICQSCAVSPLCQHP